MKDALRSILGLEKDTGIQQAAYDAGQVPDEQTDGATGTAEAAQRPESLPSRDPDAIGSVPPPFAIFVENPRDLIPNDIVTICRECDLVWHTRTVADADELAALHRERVEHDPDIQVMGDLLMEDEAWTVSCADCGLMWLSLLAEPTTFAVDHRLHTGHSVDPPRRLSIEVITERSVYATDSVGDSIAMDVVCGVQVVERNDDDSSGAAVDEDHLARWSTAEARLSLPRVAGLFPNAATGEADTGAESDRKKF